MVGENIIKIITKIRIGILLLFLKALVLYKIIVRNVNNTKYLISSFCFYYCPKHAYVHTYVCMYVYVYVCHKLLQPLYETGPTASPFHLMQRPSVLAQVENGRARIQSN